MSDPRDKRSERVSQDGLCIEVDYEFHDLKFDSKVPDDLKPLFERRKRERREAKEREAREREAKERGDNGKPPEAGDAPPDGKPAA